MTPDRTHRVRLVQVALAQRDDLLRHLGGRESPSSFQRLRVAAPETWSFLLRVESCALPLVARLRSEGMLDAFDDATRRVLHAAEASELQRVLAARLLIRELDDIASQADLRFTLLKGGAIAAETTRQPLDLGDVDVLIAPQLADAAWRALLARGWSPVAERISPAEALGSRTHYAPLRSDRHQLALELHARFAYRGDEVAAPSTLTPLASFRALDRLSGVGALAATLRHSVVAHPHRRGHLRDLFLLAELLKDLDVTQRSELDRNLADDDCEVELLAMLAQARALAEGGPLADHRALHPFVALKYAGAAGSSALLGTRSLAWNAMSHVPLERRATRRAAYRRLLGATTEAVPAESALQRNRWFGSRLSRALGVARFVRFAYRTALVVAMIVAGGPIRRHVRALERGSGRG